MKKKLFFIIGILFSFPVFWTGIFSQTVTSEHLKYNIVAEKIYEDNTRICYFEFDKNISDAKKEFIEKEAAKNQNIMQLYFYKGEERTVMFRSPLNFNADSVVDFISNISDLYGGVHKSPARAPDACPIVDEIKCGVTYSGTLGTTGNFNTYTGCTPQKRGEEHIYSFTPTRTGDYIFTATQTLNDPDFFLMSTCDNTGTNLIGSCWDFGENTVMLTKNTTYYLIADNKDNNRDAAYTITVECPPEVAGGGINCYDSGPFCTNSAYFFPSSVNTPGISGTVGCLTISKNPVWYWLLIDQPGDMNIAIRQTDAAGIGADVDFIAWGPFTSIENACNNIDYNYKCPYMPGRCPDNTAQPNYYPVGNIADCSYDAAASEICHIRNAQRGEVYMFLITNYKNVPANLHFEKVSGTATTNCDIIASSIINNGPLCEGETLRLEDIKLSPEADYYWTGPDGWTSTLQSPTIPNVTPANAGEYTLVKTIVNSATGETETSPVQTATVIVNSPSDTTFIIDSICITAFPYVENGFNAATEGIYKLDLKNINGCDSTAVLNLKAIEVPFDTIIDTICLGETYSLHNFNEMPNAAGTHYFNDTLPTALFCDSIVTLQLTVMPAYNDTIRDTICELQIYEPCGCQYAAGEYEFITRTTTANNCDSTVTLILLVVPKSYTEIFDTICSNETVDFNGQTLNLPDIYYDTLKNSAGCDSIVALHLSVEICYDVVVQSIEEICADDENFYVTLETTGGGVFDCFSASFPQHAKDAGFVDIECKNINGNALEIPVPQNIRPNYYTATLTLYCNDNSNITKDLEFTILYASSIIKQKWNNVLALTNEYYNGGYGFKFYEWYKNNNKIEGENSSYIYLGENNTLDFTAEYRAKLTRIDDGETIFTCPLKPEQHTDSQFYPSLVDAGSIMYIPAKAGGTATVISISGIKITNQPLTEGDNYIKMPSVSGFYIMLLEGSNKEPTKQIIIVK